MPFEKVWIERVASLNKSVSIISPLPNSLLENTQFEKNDPHVLLQGHHDHNKWDPHIWLSPILAIEHAKVLVHELIRVSP